MISEAITIGSTPWTNGMHREIGVNQRPVKSPTAAQIIYHIDHVRKEVVGGMLDAKGLTELLDRGLTLKVQILAGRILIEIRTARLSGWDVHLNILKSQIRGGKL
jgi:hypothetical protein